MLCCCWPPAQPAAWRHGAAGACAGWWCATTPARLSTVTCVTNTSTVGESSVRQHQTVCQVDLPGLHGCLDRQQSMARNDDLAAAQRSHPGTQHRQQHWQ
jgi:hypothetical protein